MSSCKAYNTSLVRKQDLPKRWTDLLDPRWRGKLGAEAASGEWYCTLVKSVNPELLRTIAARNGSACIRQLVLANMVVSGEVSLARPPTPRSSMRRRSAGADRLLIIEPLIGRVNGIGVSRKPPHPSAARFSTSYNIGESQPLMVKLHYFSPLKNSPAAGGRKMVFVDLSMDSAESSAATVLMNSLMRIKE